MTEDDELKQDITAKHRRASSIGGRTAQYIGAGRPITSEQLRAGRQKSLRVRQLKKEQRAGLLRKWHWRAMVTAWKARPQGVRASSGWHADYGNIAQKVWVRLRDYPKGALVETYATLGERGHGVDYIPHIYWIRLTPFGEQFYRERWQRYRELYPEVDAPAPGEESGHG